MEGCRKSEEGREGWRVRARERKRERGRAPDSLGQRLVSEELGAGAGMRLCTNERGGAGGDALGTREFERSVLSACFQPYILSTNPLPPNSKPSPPEPQHPHPTPRTAPLWRRTLSKRGPITPNPKR
jgi:hypothetical protein